MWFRKKCSHQWHEVLTRTETEYEDTGRVVDSYNRKYTYLFCPICDMNKKLSNSEAELILKKQEIKNNYRFSLIDEKEN